MRKITFSIEDGCCHIERDLDGLQTAEAALLVIAMRQQADIIELTIKQSFEIEEDQDGEV